ncbi:glycosyltransferase family 2 protein [Accumulibacter sp.]|uniref:glycosyltransferase family 2 protein n=1 Tax=Accumulibacter sp. TaxID=2053492 RepID=UPI0025D4D9C0|nr:glycosyltransferase family 2 protein [Accumulibacter sp.]MCM8611625.1 glycosyltransferase [Accumulibacter sp.]MCM8635390.1 glycosyltransferase [Accumulibacter sp.]MCM8638995.1 glycosyltransferase [Accumulibacter sp.]
MKVSVITCTWNSVATLAATIDSVQAQDYPNVEHLFVDGGSSDGTLDMIAVRCPYAVVVRGVFGGISRAMNAGIEAASGEVIAHLHSDDYYLAPDVLGRAARVLEESGRDWLIGRTVNDVDGRLESVAKPRSSYSPTSFAQGQYFIPHPATFVRRVVFERVGVFDERLRYAMDVDLWLRIGAAGIVPAEVDDCLAVFRMHSGSLSNANAMASMRECYRVNLRHAGHWPLSFTKFSARYAYRFVRRYVLERRATSRRRST